MDKNLIINHQNYQYYVCDHVEEVFRIVKDIFYRYENLFPANKQAKILVKPNLNSNMNALTGNTTDLRIIAAVLNELSGRGYKNIIVGEGTSSGFYRNKINIANRLYVLDLIRKFDGVRFLDLNYDEKFIIDFEDSVKANIAKTCIDADFFINLPKIKTHFETMMSVCLKSLIGCLIGLNEKQKAHYSLFKNIIHLNENIKPNLTIVDGLISMEGTGPSLGSPIKTDVILAGENPYLLDLLSAKLADIDYRRIPVLIEAKKKGYLTENFFKEIKALKSKRTIHNFKKPAPSFWAKVANNQKWQKYLIKLRIGHLNWFFNLKVIGNLLNLLGLRQDIFNMEESNIKEILPNPQYSDCDVCEKYCPMRLKFKDIGRREKGCIGCLYCYFVHPEAVSVKGEFGFLVEQSKMYGEKIREIGKQSVDLDNNDRVSIVIPTYNSAKTLRGVILSCLAQTYKNIEIIVVDNNSNDNTKKIAMDLGVRVYNIGPERAAQRNFGAKMATGDYLIFLDSDIFLSNKVVEECLKTVKYENADIITFREFVVGEGFWTMCRKIEAQCYFGDDTIEAPRFYSKRTFFDIGKYDENLNLTGTEDWDLREMALKKGYKIFRIASPTYHYEGRTYLKKRIINKCYYAQSFIVYNDKYKGKTKIPFFRKCYIKNWRLLIHHPILTSGFMFMKVLEGVAALYTMKKLNKSNKITNQDIYQE